MRSLVVAPHPDDETLGAGGAILRRKSEGHETAWLIVTDLIEGGQWTKAQISKRNQEINEVAEILKFDKVFRLNLPTTELDSIPLSRIVKKISRVFLDYQPNEVFVPHFADIHSDHKVVFQAVASCTKSFRYPSIMRVLAYETLSETEFNLDRSMLFHPNYFMNIDDFIDIKCEAMNRFSSEVENFPFPRSYQAIKALANLRGAASGFQNAEAFEILRERT